MSLSRLSNRAVLGRIMAAMGNSTGAAWLGSITNYVESDQGSEEYAWLGQAPTLREMTSGRHKKDLRDFGYEIPNLEFEATLGIHEKHLSRDKTGQLDIKVNDFATRANQHWASLISALINVGHSSVCYDGQYFFATDHSEGESGTQDNDLSKAAATGTTPTAIEMQDGILDAIAAIMGFKDDQGEPINADVNEFTIMVPTALMPSAIKATDQMVISAGESNVLRDAEGLSVKRVINPRLSSAATIFVFANSPASSSAFIRQEEVAPEYSELGEGSDHFFNTRENLFGLYSRRNAGYGLWQRSARVQFT